MRPLSVRLRIRSTLRSLRAGVNSPVGAAIIGALTGAVIAAVVAYVSAAPSRPSSTSITVDGKLNRQAEQQCVTFSGTAGQKDGWTLWSAASSADTDGAVWLVPVDALSKGDWRISLNLGQPPYSEDQTIDVRFFYLDEASSDLIRGVNTRAFYTMPVAARDVQGVSVSMKKGSRAVACAR